MRRLEPDLAVAVEREGAAVEDKLVLAAELVDVEERKTALLHPRRGELGALHRLVALEGRPVDDEEELGAALRQRRRDVGEPHILADHEAEGNAAEQRRLR